MKVLTHWFFGLVVTVILTSCADYRDKREHEARQREIGPVMLGDSYQFKDSPNSSTAYLVKLQGVKNTSAFLGPDFKVRYFDFEDDASLALYCGGHPQTREGAPLARFNSRFARRLVKWEIRVVENGDWSGWAYLDLSTEDGPPIIWHIMVTARNRDRVKAIARQLDSFRRIRAE
jgi:hypothetical protein